MISLVLPTYNEAQNIRGLIEHIDGVLREMPHEIIIVDDDSPDRTWKVAERLKEEFSAIRVIRRIGKRGLSSAVVEGFDAAHGDQLMVMDADGQHDAALLLAMCRAIDDGVGMVIGSRYVEGGSVGDWVTDRRIVSKAGTLLAQNLSRVHVTDPLSGFFALRKDLYLSIRRQLRPSGFKILLEILSRVPQETVIREIPLTFRMRQHGESKLSLEVHIQFFLQVLRIALSRASRLGPLLFVIAILISVLLWLPRAWALRAMYVDATLRSQVRTALTTVASREGWLLSDIELLSVSHGALAIRHHDHLRVPTPSTDCTVTLPSNTLACGASSR